jgi:putative peptide zinc metalloprotease protein
VAGALLRPLFRGPIVVAVIGSALAVDYWLFTAHGLGGGIRQVLRDPVGLLVVCGLSVVSAVFHECGHAAGCRYGGARPGVIGVGIYLVWPSFFTNVTDSYRLSRAGRLRTDLGGLYFNLIFILALAGIYSATSAEVLLLVIAVTHVEMLEQLLPFVRFDGYFILSDLVGVPDLFARVAPILRNALPKGPRDPRVTGLRRRARIVVTGWVLCVIPLLTFSIGYLLLHLPRIDRALWRSGSWQAHLTVTAAAGHRYAMAAVDAIGVALLALSLAGSLYIVIGLARRLATAGLRWFAGHPARRLLAAVAGLVCMAALAAFWTVQGQFHGW